MPYALPDARSVHPIVLPNGQPHLGTVFLRNSMDHPKFEVRALPDTQMQKRPT